MTKWRSAGLKGCLVISRKEGQRVVINHGEVMLEIVQIRGKQVRIAFVAAKDIPIQRGEALEASDEKDSTDER